MEYWDHLLDCTFMSQGHLDLQCLEIVRDIGLGLATHPFACPLLEAIELLVDVHLKVEGECAVSK